MTNPKKPDRTVDWAAEARLMREWLAPVEKAHALDVKVVMLPTGGYTVAIKKKPH